jgi:hypothetical protein
MAQLAPGPDCHPAGEILALTKPLASWAIPNATVLQELLLELLRLGGMTRIITSTAISNVGESSNPLGFNGQSA